MTLHPKNRATAYMVCCLIALLAFHAAFIALIAGRSLVIPLVLALMSSAGAGGYAWPPIGNRAGWFEAATLLGWSHRQAHRTFILVNVVAVLLLVDGVVFLATS